MSPRARSGATPLAGQKVAAREAPNQTYGERAQQQQDQRVVPVAEQPNAANDQQQGGDPNAQADAAASVAPRRPVPAPGTLPWTTEPTNRPSEPVTAGLPFGAGPGPEAMKAPSTTAPLIGDQLAAMAADPNASGAVIQLANVARALGI